MRGKLISTIFAWLCLFTGVNAQAPRHVELMNDPYARFEETVQEFEKYWQNRTVEPHSGWKPFKRWEYYMSSRLDSNGRQTGPLRVMEEMERYSASHPGAFDTETGKRSSTSGNWQPRGPYPLPYNDSGQPNGMGRIASIAFHPLQSSWVYIGSASGGIWKSTDNGSTWSDISSGLTRLGVSSIVFHPTAPDTIYIGTGDRDAGDAPGYGVWRSTNGGATWAARNNTMGNLEVAEILMHPSNPAIMICAAGNKIFRTTNSGANWTQSFTGHTCNDLAFYPGSPDTVYAAGTNLYRSTDNGITWTQITSGLPAGSSRYALAVSAQQPSWVYVFSGTGSGFQGLYQSTDGGLNFTTRSTTPNICGYGSTGGTGSQAWYDLVLNADPGNASTIYAGAVNIWKSTDAGATWAIKAHWVGSGAAPVHADQHVLEWNPHNGNLFSGNDGGIYYTTNGGTAWTDITSGLNIGQVYKIGVSGNRPDLTINGYQDNGTAFNRTSLWYTPMGGDGMEAAVDPTNDAIMYCSIYNGDIYQAMDGGVYFNQIAGNGDHGINESGAWVTPYKLNPNNSDVMAIGFKNIWRSTNVRTVPYTGITWTKISAFAGSNNIIDLEFARSNSDTMYVSRSGTSRLLFTPNFSAPSPTWTDLSSTLPATGNITDIEVHPTLASTLWISIGTEIYKSTDAGASWTLFSGTLPNIALNTIVYDRLSPVGAMYVGMDVGVYYRDNNLTDWIAYSSGLANVEVTELEIYYDPECRDKDKLVAGTYGRGLWDSDLRDPGSVLPATCFQAIPATSVCTGLPVTLQDQTGYNPTSWSWSITPGTFIFTNGTNATTQHPVVIFQASGTYSVTLNATNSVGSAAQTRTNYITVSGGGTIIPPISENFESTPLCSGTQNCAVATCSMTNGWINESNNVQDDLDWRTFEGNTPTSSTGPSQDFSPGTATGNYAYIDAFICYGKIAHLVSPCIDLTSASTAQMTFAYHMFGVDIGSLHVDVFDNGTWINDVTAAIIGNQGNSWQTRAVSLTPYAGRVIKIRFRGITGDGDKSDIAIDAIDIQQTGVLAESGFAFNGERISWHDNLLHWNTGIATGGDVFLLDRQTESGAFTLLGTTAVTSGKSAYQHRDLQPRAGMNIYRLRVQHPDGNAEIAGWAEIFNGTYGGSLSAWPNPTRDLITLELKTDKAGESLLEISDLNGRIFLTRQLTVKEGINRFSPDLSECAPGIWLVKWNGNVVKVAKE